MALPSSGNLSLLDIEAEMWSTASGNASLEALSIQANKIANHGIAEFYGFNGLAIFSLTETFASSSSMGSFTFFKSVQVSPSNVLGRTCTVRLRRFVSVYRHSSGSTAGSVYSEARLSTNMFYNFIRAQRTGGPTGWDTLSQEDDLIWNDSTYGVFSLVQSYPNPKPSSVITLYSSVSIISVFGQIKSSIHNSVKTFGPN